MRRISRVNTAFRAFEFRGARLCMRSRRVSVASRCKRSRGVACAEVKSSLPCLGLAHAGRNTVATFSHELNSAARAADNARRNRAWNWSFIRASIRLISNLDTADWRFDWTRERDALLSPQFAEAVSANGYIFADRITAAQSSADPDTESQIGKLQERTFAAQFARRREKTFRRTRSAAEFSSPSNFPAARRA